MSVEKELIEALKKFKKQEMQVVPCKVEAVDEALMTLSAKPIDGSAMFKNVRLSASIDSSEEKIILIPKVGSWVLVARILNDDKATYVAKYSECVKIVIKMGQTTLEVDDAGNWKFNGGDLGGMAKTEKVSERIKRLEDELESLKDSYNNHTHLYNPGPSAPVASAVPLPIVSPGLMPRTTQEYISNENIKH